MYLLSVLIFKLFWYTNGVRTKILIKLKSLVLVLLKITQARKELYMDERHKLVNIKLKELNTFIEKLLLSIERGSIKIVSNKDIDILKHKYSVEYLLKQIQVKTNELDFVKGL